MVELVDITPTQASNLLLEHWQPELVYCNLLTTYGFSTETCLGHF